MTRSPSGPSSFFPARAVLGLAALAALALSGCMKTKDDVKVKADGSGTFSESIELDTAALEQARAAAESLRGMLPGGGPGARPPGEPGAEPPKPDDPAAPAKPPEDFQKRLEGRWKEIPGLKVTKQNVGEKDGKKTIDVEAEFTTLEAYAQATAFDMSADLAKNADGSYTLKFEGRFGPGRGMGRGRGGPGMGDAPPGEPPPEGAPGMDGAPPPGPGGMAGMGAGLLTAFEKPLAGLEFTRTLRLPGTIVETSGTKSDDGTSVTWKLTFDDIKNGNAKPQTVTFKGDGLDLKPFAVKRSARRSLMGGGRPDGPPPGPPPAPGMDDGGK